MVWAFFILSYGRTYLKENPLNYWTLYPFLWTFVIDLCSITYIRRCPYRNELRLCDQATNSMETTNITSKCWLFQLLISPLEIFHKYRDIAIHKFKLQNEDLYSYGFVLTCCNMEQKNENITKQCCIAFVGLLQFTLWTSCHVSQYNRLTRCYLPLLPRIS